jgi:hypothetical protein
MMKINLPNSGAGYQTTEVDTSDRSSDIRDSYNIGQRKNIGLSDPKKYPPMTIRLATSGFPIIPIAIELNKNYRTCY